MDDFDGSRSPHSTVYPSTCVRRLPSINVLIIYSLTVRFDHTFSIISLGITFCLLQLSPKTQSWGSLSAFCTIPKIFTNWSNLPVSEHP